MVFADCNEVKVEAVTVEELLDVDWLGSNFVNLLKEKKLCGGGGGCLRMDLPGRIRVTADDDGDDEELDDATEMVDDEADGPDEELGIVIDSDECELVAMVNNRRRLKFKRKMLESHQSARGYVII